MKTYQQIIAELKSYWAENGAIIQEPLDVEVGAGTMCPETFLRVLGPKPYRVAYVQPSRRPADGRYGDNPNRLYKHMQLQVILEAIARRHHRAIHAEPGGDRHRLYGGMTSSSKKTIGKLQR